MRFETVRPKEERVRASQRGDACLDELPTCDRNAARTATQLLTPHADLVDLAVLAWEVDPTIKAGADVGAVTHSWE